MTTRIYCYLIRYLFRRYIQQKWKINFNIFGNSSSILLNIITIILIRYLNLIFFFNEKFYILGIEFKHRILQRNIYIFQWKYIFLQYVCTLVKVNSMKLFHWIQNESNSTYLFNKFFPFECTYLLPLFDWYISNLSNYIIMNLI